MHHNIIPALLAANNLQKSPKISIFSASTSFGTENPSGSSKVDGLSPFQVHIIHLETLLQYFPTPWVPAPSSYLYRSRNSAPERQFSSNFFSMKTWSNWAKETALSSIRYALKHIPTSARSHPSFLEQQALQVIAGSRTSQKSIRQHHI